MYAIGRIPGRGRFRALAAAVLAALLFAASPASATSNWCTPSTPTLSATAGDGQVTLSWTSDRCASTYQLRQSEDGGSSWDAWSTVSNEENDKDASTVTGLTNGNAYTFQCRGYRVGHTPSEGFIYVYSDPSASVTATPTASE